MGFKKRNLTTVEVVSELYGRVGSQELYMCFLNLCKTKASLRLWWELNDKKLTCLFIQTESNMRTGWDLSNKTSNMFFLNMCETKTSLIAGWELNDKNLISFQSYSQKYMRAGWDLWDKSCICAFLICVKVKRVRSRQDGSWTIRMWLIFLYSK